MKIIINIIKLIRPKHWLKNFLVFAAIFFAFQFNIESMVKASLIFISFSLFASSIYVINDLFDQKLDRLHPKKRFRPIASGEIKIWQALIIFSILFIGGAIIAVSLSVNVFYTCLAYFIINLAYSLGFKQLAIIDVMIVAFGFVLRVMAGAFAINVPISHWLLLCTFFISLFLAFGKRKNEMDILLDTESRKHRTSISEYTEGFINQMLAITAGISVVFYSLYTIDAETIARFGNSNLIYTTPIVVFAILRYFHLLYNKKDGGDPVAIFVGDIQMIVAVLLWLSSVIFIHQFK